MQWHRLAVAGWDNGVRMTPQAWISTIVLLMFGMAMVLVFFRIVPPGSEAALNILLGVLGNQAAQCVSYWVGSSSNSARKTEIMAAAAGSESANASKKENH